MDDSIVAKVRSKSSGRKKPEKPAPDFPLFAHPSGQWAKKIRGKLAYFGSWRQDRDGKKAEARFVKEEPYLKEGKTPPSPCLTRTENPWVNRSFAICN